MNLLADILTGLGLAAIAAVALNLAADYFLPSSSARFQERVGTLAGACIVGAWLLLPAAGVVYALASVL